MTLNLKKTELTLLLEIAEGAEFWCTDCDADADCPISSKRTGQPGSTESCGSCPKYLDWEKTKKELIEKLDSSSPSSGHPKISLELQLQRASYRRCLAQIQEDKLKRKLEVSR